METTRDLLQRLSPEKRALLALRLAKGRKEKRPSFEDAAPIAVDRANRYAPFPLTDLQQAYWVGRIGGFEIGNVATHSYLELENAGVHLVRLNQAWQKVIERHDMLRAVFLPDGQQQVLETVPFYHIRTTDLRRKADGDVEAGIVAIREELSHQVLPTDKWPLFDIRAAQMDSGKLRLFISFDGLILDGYSMLILLKDWARYYEAPDTNLEPLELSFRDYAMAEVALQKTEAYERARQYWLKLIPDLPPAPDLPLARDATAISAPRFIRRHLTLQPEDWQQLKARAAKSKITPTGLLLAVYAEVIAVWSKSQSFTINVPKFNRRPVHSQVHQIAGEFASLSLLAVDNTAPDSFEVRARRLQERLWNDLDNNLFNGVRVMRELAQFHGPDSRMIMPVVFTGAPQDTEGKDATLLNAPEALGKVLYRINQSSQVWLDAHVTERDGALNVDWDSVDEVFPEGVPQQMLEAYDRLLGKLLKEEATWKKDGPELAARLLPQAQLARRKEINSTTAPIPESLAQDLFISQLAHSPDYAAVITTRKTLTYDQLVRLANRWGRCLRQLGARPNTLVAVVMEKGWEQIVGVMGIVQSGAAYLPIDAEVPKERLWYLLEHGQVGLVLTQSWIDQALQWPETVRRLCVDADNLEEVSDEPLEHAQTPDDLMYVLYTSGSTGLPKGAMIGHRGVVNALIQTNQHFDVGSRDRVLALTALHHDMSVYDIFGVLGAGGTIVMPEAAERRDPAHWCELISRHGVTIWNSVPAMMEMLLEYASCRQDVIPQSLRLAFLGGDWIQVTLPARFWRHAKNVRIVSVGGPTETTLWNIWHPIDQYDPSWKTIPYGKPIANTKYYIYHDSLVDCPTWVPGEMCCAGVGVAKGYWQDDEKSRAKFLIHPRTGERIYRTGDLGRYLPDGNIEFVGRIDFQVKIQGQRIELGEIESALQQHPKVRAAVVAAVGETQGKKRLVAYVVATADDGFSEAELRTYLQGKLPPYMVPSAFVRLDRLPLTPNGKVNRLNLPLPDFQEPDSSAAPSVGASGEQSDLVTRVTKLVASVLNINSVDPKANLMSLGANSIDVIRIGNLLEKEFGIRIQMGQLFRLQTTVAIANYCEEHLPKYRSASDTARTGLAPELSAIIASYPKLLDPAEREAFKNSQPGIRRDLGKMDAIPLVGRTQTEEVQRQYSSRRSYRSYSLKPIPFEKFSLFLSCLSQIILNGKPKYLYASPGGLYPSQVYLHVKPGRIDQIPAGTHYYHPLEHRLIVLTPNVDIDRTIHIPFINVPIFDEAAFSIFLIAQLSAIAPSYGDRSIHFVTLEAGIIAHLLETMAIEFNIGLCQIGSVDFGRIRDLFLLEKSHVLIHSLVGGLVSPGQEPDQTTSAETTQKESDKVVQIMQRIKQLSQEEVKALLEANKSASDRTQSK